MLIERDSRKNGAAGLCKELLGTLPMKPSAALPLPAELLWPGYFAGLQNELCKTINFTFRFPQGPRAREEE
jgi:hypothetical protein